MAMELGNITILYLATLKRKIMIMFSVYATSISATTRKEMEWN